MGCRYHCIEPSRDPPDPDVSFPEREKIKKDDIRTLADNLKNRTTNQKVKTFLTRSHRRFEDADKLRNRCAHVIEGDPTKQEIEQSIALARLLQKYMPRK